MKDFTAFDISFNGKKNIDYDLNQLICLYLNARTKNISLVLPENLDGVALAEFLNFLNKYKEVFNATKKGLKSEWFCGYSLLSNDEKALYIFSFEKAGTPLYINGVNNKKKTVSILPENKNIATDSSVGLGAGPGTIWLELDKNDIHVPCTVIKISFDEKIKLYAGTGAPITQN